ncbi:MAG TPA: Holliday junction resolvase RuvX [Candidatus Tumulicola sp.]
MPAIGLDVGERRIGVAVADPGGTYAMPVATIDRTATASDIARIVELAASYGADEIVVGDPVTLSGERGPAATKMDAFVEKLSRSFSGEIHRVDERLTTAQATKTLIAADVSRKRRKRVVDRMAAALILETYLQRKRRSDS